MTTAGMAAASIQDPAVDSPQHRAATLDADTGYSRGLEPSKREILPQVSLFEPVAKNVASTAGPTLRWSAGSGRPDSGAAPLEPHAFPTSLSGYLPMTDPYRLQDPAEAGTPNAIPNGL